MSDAMLFLPTLAVLALLWLTARRWSFDGQQPEHYAGTAPDFDLSARLSGLLVCEGVIYGPLGRVTSRFVAEMEGEWDGPRGVLRERFLYDSGLVQNREWRLTLEPSGAIRAEAADVVGTGSGRQEGAALGLRYLLRLPEQAGGHVLSVTDWMYLAPNGTILNRSQFRKFGFKVAELVATIRPVADAARKAA